jgi:hypothetical protein
VACFLYGRPSSAPTPTHLRVRASLPPVTTPPSLIGLTRLSGRLPPNPSLLQRRASSPVSSLLLSHPRIDSFLAQCRHPCTSTRELSRRHSCSVESCRHCCLRSTLLHAATPACWCQPLSDEASSRLLH